MTSWLQKKRKGELLELAQQANLSDVEGLLKDDLVDALQSHLESNESMFSKQSPFSDFYRRNSHGSPVKRERGSPADASGAITVTKTRRRQTRLPDDDILTPAKETAKAIVARTPRTVSKAVQRVTSQVDLPASPAHVADLADQSFQAAKSKASELWKRTSVEEAITYARENASSVTFVQLVILLLEASGLQWNTLVTEPAFTTPSFGSRASGRVVYFPDYTKLLTTNFWAPAALWGLTSIFVPLLASYFVNLTLRSNTKHKSTRGTYAVDPLTFSMVKALLQYLVYQPVAVPMHIPTEGGVADILYPAWGPFSGSTRVTVEQSVPGGYLGLQIGAAVGAIISIYDAALKK